MFDRLETKEQVDYLQHCLPKEPFQEVVAKYEDGEYTEETVSHLLDEGKKIIISQMQKGRDQWEYLLEQKEMLSEDFKNEHTYRELAYYLSAMGDSGLATFAHPFRIEEGTLLAEYTSQDSKLIEELRQHLISRGEMTIQKGFSIVGSDIWRDLGSEPIPRLAYFEDPEHVYIEFWLRTDTDTMFHERRGKFIEFPVLRKVICRVHLDEKFIELRGRNERIKDKEAGLQAIKEFFNDELRFSDDSEIATDGGQDFEINDEIICSFYELPEFERLTHANKEGTATSSWTADDVRNDDQYPEDRPNNYNNLVFELNSVGRVSFQLNAEEDSYQIFKHKIMPDAHQEVSEYIYNNINNASN